MLKINVVPYDPQWPAHFAEIATTLSSALSDFLPSSAFDIQHVGSTSVPGLPAKPIIDIDIIVTPCHIMEACQALAAYGYTYAYEPNGIDRMVFRYNAHTLDSGGSKPTEDGTPRRAVYLNKAGGAALANHLAVRDTLRRDAVLRDEYGALKLQLAREEHEDIGAYGEKKGEMIGRILQCSGLDEEELRRIRYRPERAVDVEIRAARKAERERARPGDAL